MRKKQSTIKNSKGSGAEKIMNRKGRVILGCILVILFFITQQGLARGIGVNPGRLAADNIPLGRRINLEEFSRGQGYLLIENKNPQATRFSVNILRTKETRAELIAGYQDIPDTNWVQPQAVGLIPADSNKRTDLYIEIPDQSRYAGKAYQAVIEVKSQKNKPTDLFVYAAQIRLLVNTEEKP